MVITGIKNVENRLPHDTTTQNVIIRGRRAYDGDAAAMRAAHACEHTGRLRATCHECAPGDAGRYTAETHERIPQEYTN